MTRAFLLLFMMADALVVIHLVIDFLSGGTKGVKAAIFHLAGHTDVDGRWKFHSESEVYSRFVRLVMVLGVVTVILFVLDKVFRRRDKLGHAAQP